MRCNFRDDDAIPLSFAVTLLPLADTFFFHVDDLNPAVLRAERIGFVLELRLVVADRHEGRGGDLELFNQVALDRIGALLGKVLVERVAALPPFGRCGSLLDAPVCPAGTPTSFKKAARCYVRRVPYGLRPQRVWSPGLGLPTSTVSMAQWNPRRSTPAQ